MANEPLTHSDRYVRKTNRVILIIGIVTLFVFLFGLMLLGSTQEEKEQHYEIERTISAESDLGFSEETNNEAEIEFDDSDEAERPITMIPNPVNMGQVVLGNEAINVLTIGTNGRREIKIISVDLEDVAPEGFIFVNNCNGRELRGKVTCTVTMKWTPTVAANVQNNFKIIWHETNVSDKSAKHDEVPVFGNAITKENCNFCDAEAAPSSGMGNNATASSSGKVRYAIAPDGSIIGVIDENGIVRDANGREIGRVNADGMVVDNEGNIIGVASTGKLILDENGNVIGYVDEAGVAHDNEGNVIGTMLADGTIVDADGKVIGKAVDYGYIYDDEGNIIGRVLADGSAVDLDGNVIGRVDKDGNVVDANGNIIGRVAKSGEVAFDENGNQIGVVLPNGDVVDENGEIVGRMQADGTITSSQYIGKRGSTARMAVDKDGNVIGYIDENGNVRDFNGNIIGVVDKDGNVVDAKGNVIGKVSDEWRDLALDANGNVIGYIDKDGLVHNNDGEIIGYVDADGKIIGNSEGELIPEIIGGVDSTRRLVLDKDGNVIGYADADGTVRDLSGNVIGKVDKDGNVVDKNGKIIGKVSDNSKRLVRDKDGNIIGYADADGTVHDLDGKVIGKVDKNGNVVDKDGNIIGKVSNEDARVVVDKDGKVIGYADADGTIRDLSGKVIGKVDKDGNIIDKDGNIIGKVDKDGNIVDKDGNIIGKVSDKARKYAFDKNGKLIGEVFPDGDVFDLDGNLIGKADKDGSVKEVKEKSNTAPKIGVVGKRVALARDADGNVIGYIDEHGNLIDENGNIIGKVDEKGNVYDLDGNIIGHSEETANVVLDEKGKIAGYVDEKGVAHDKSGKVVGVVDAVGNVRTLGTKVIGSILNKDLLPITPLGTVLGTINNRGEVVNQKKVVGKMRTDGLVTDSSGARILAKGVPAGYLVNWGCDYSHKLDKDGIIRHNGEDTDYRIYADGTAWTSDGKFMGKIISTGPVYDGHCRYIGEVYADGYVRNTNNEEIGCLNPDGTVLDLEEPVVKGHLVERKTVISSRSWKPIGRLEVNGTLKNSAGDVIGCSNVYGDVYDSRNVYIGSVSDGKYAYGFDGKYLGGLDLQGGLKLKGFTGAYLTINNLIADKNGQIIGYMMPEISVFVNSSGQKIGHLFPDGVVYNDSGVAVDRFNGGGSGYYGNSAAMYVIPYHVVDADGQNIGRVNYDLNVVDYQGTVIGRVNEKGQMFDKQGRLAAGVVRQGGTRGFGGAYLGYVVPTGEVVELEEVKAGSQQYRRGEITGKVTPDGQVIKDGNILGEVLSQNVMVDVFGQPVGLSNDHGEIVNPEARALGVVLPGGGNKNNYSYLRSGIVIDFGGNVIGVVLPNGNFMDKSHVISGRVLTDGKVISSDGRFLGEVVSGDIVIGNNDSVQGYIGFDGTIYKGGSVVGRILTDGLAADKQNNIIGRTYSIGNAIVSNNGSYIGRLAANGRVLTITNKDIGHIKSNGSFVDVDKNVSGYSLPEVARNRRN